jgi:hypothetical protein
MIVMWLAARAASSQHLSQQSHFQDAARSVNQDNSSRTSGRCTMAKGQQKKSKEARKPKKEKPKTIAANPSSKGLK